MQITYPALINLGKLKNNGRSEGTGNRHTGTLRQAQCIAGKTHV